MSRVARPDARLSARVVRSLARLAAGVVNPHTRFARPPGEIFGTLCEVLHPERPRPLGVA